MEVSLRGSYGVQLQPVKRAALSHHCDIAGLVASGTPLSLSSRLFSCFVVTGTGHANLLTSAYAALVRRKVYLDLDLDRDGLAVLHGGLEFPAFHCCDGLFIESHA